MTIDLVILTPGINFTSNFVKSLVKTAKYLDANNIRWEWINAYNSNVNAAREITLERFAKNNDSDYFDFKFDYKKFIWIDSDISWEPEDIIKLYKSDLDIVTGVYYLNEDVPAIYKSQWSIIDKETLYNSSQLKISGCGFGFLAVKKGVFESIKRPIFNHAKELTLGEDLLWCEKVTDLGYDIYVDTTVNLGHAKRFILSKDGIFLE